MLRGLLASETEDVLLECGADSKVDLFELLHERADDVHVSEPLCLEKNPQHPDDAQMMRGCRPAITWPLSAPPATKSK